MGSECGHGSVLCVGTGEGLREQLWTGGPRERTGAEVGEELEGVAGEVEGLGEATAPGQRVGEVRQESHQLRGRDLRALWPCGGGGDGCTREWSARRPDRKKGNDRETG